MSNEVTAYEDQEEIEVTESQSRLGNELKQMLGDENVRELHRLFAIIDNEDYETKADEKFLIDEFTTYLASLYENMMLIYYDQLILRHGPKCLLPGDINEHLQKPALLRPYAVRKDLSRRFRAAFWQMFVELGTIVTDILFWVFNLNGAEDDLFLAALVILVCAFGARLISGLRLVRFIDSKKRNNIVLFTLGFVVNLFETNTGLFLMKRTLDLRDPDGLRNPYASKFGPQAKRDRDRISSEAQKNSRAGWSEIWNVVAVTVIEDIPMLVVDIIFFQRNGLDSVGYVFLLSMTTTILHILLQWFEAVITLYSILYSLNAISAQREVNITSDSFSSSRGPNPSLTHFMRKVNLQELEDQDADVYITQSQVFPLHTIKLAKKFKAEKFVENMSHLGNLVEFESWGCTREVLLQLASTCKFLRTLQLGGNENMDDEVLSCFAVNCRLLRDIVINCTNVYEIDSIVKISRSAGHNLHFLGILNANGLLTPGAMEEIIRSCPGLRDLMMWEYKAWDDEILASLSTNKARFERFTLTFAMAEEDSQQSAGRFHNMLKEYAFHSVFRLDLSFTPLGDHDLEALANNCPKIVWLNMNHTNVTDKGLETLSKGKLIGGIHQIFLNHTDVGNEGVHFIIDAWHESLSLIGVFNTKVNSEGVKNIAVRCNGNLEYLYFYNRSGFFEDLTSTVTALALHCPKLKSLYMPEAQYCTLESMYLLSKSCALLQTIGFHNERAPENVYHRFVRDHPSIEFVDISRDLEQFPKWQRLEDTRHDTVRKLFQQGQVTENRYGKRPSEETIEMWREEYKQTCPCR